MSFFLAENIKLVGLYLIYWHAGNFSAQKNKNKKCRNKGLRRVPPEKK